MYDYESGPLLSSHSHGVARYYALSVFFPSEFCWRYEMGFYFTDTDLMSMLLSSLCSHKTYCFLLLFTISSFLIHTRYPFPYKLA